MSNEIPESEVSSQEKPQNADETVNYSCDNSVMLSNGLASDALDSNMDKVMNTSTELGEGSCSSSCSCSSSSSSSSSNDEEPPKRGKRKYSDADNSNSTDSDVPKRKLCRYVSGKKPNYKVDTSDNNTDSDTKKDPNYSGKDSDPDKTESYTSEEKIVFTKTQKTKKKIIHTKSGQIEIKHFQSPKKLRKVLTTLVQLQIHIQLVLWK